VNPVDSTARRTRARRGEGERLREEIIEAAERLLLETGSEDAVSIRAVAEAVGVTPPSIYLHFADKNELIFEVCEKHFDQFDRYLEAAAGESDDPLESLRLRGRAYVQFGLDHPEHYRILFMGKPGESPVDFEETRMRRIASFDHLVQGVQRCIDAGAIPVGDPVTLAVGMWVAVHGITSLLISKPGFPWPDVERLIDHILAVQIKGLQAD
jgi:AcrR family transcriptional regulator